MRLTLLDRLPPLDRPARRLTQLYVGLFLFGRSKLTTARIEAARAGTPTAAPVSG